MNVNRDLLSFAAPLPGRGMGGHQAAAADSEVWLTPPDLLKALGPFDLDPCACMEPRPWPTAARHYTREDSGLRREWTGRVWLNPPYGGPSIIGPWMRRMADHGHGTAIIFARTETEVFHDCVWNRASAVLFLRGRLHFHHRDGARAKLNAGAPSCLVAYGDADVAALEASGLAGKLVRL
ncbi:phage_N6A_met, phage N-6-adenine-methyltransferase [uncultured Caudovirales phage]|uniref:Phage_N6A_met, phage N-6-adenine-methyltransferase n=1 Tax=uncultured Caudovirales phage TaxID=2100421 RepID=A0A6J5M1A4_9CAUD|nr:phage_N6A_met, phage N-6-adenine-methyltransferase [uncultured Caudovirales phage]